MCLRKKDEDKKELDVNRSAITNPLNLYLVEGPQRIGIKEGETVVPP